MCLIHGAQDYWGNRFDRCLPLRDSAESNALQFMKLLLVFCGEDAYGCLKHSSEVLRKVFMYHRDV